VAAGDAIALLDRPNAGLTVAYMTEARGNKSPDAGAAARLADLVELSASWREHFSRLATPA
jgi:MOSC domain-containing protein YiiM